MISLLRVETSFSLVPKKQAQDAVKTEAICRMYYVNERWLSGMLTNFKTIRAVSIV